MFVRRFFTAAALGLVLTGPARTEEADGRTFVGPCGSDKTARVGLVADATMMVAYVCSQNEAFNSDNARWFKGSIHDGKLEAKSPDGRTMTATISGDSIEGQFQGPSGMTAFTAKVCDTTATMAGLYRAEEKEGEYDYVAGWVVDQDENVAGAINQRNNKKIVTPKPPVGAGGAANLSPRPGVKAQPIVSPRDAASVKGKKGGKFTQEDTDEKIANLEQDLGGKGGSPTLAAVIQQVKRFNAGARPEGPIEAATFAKLRRVPKAQLVDYVKNWDALPQKTRQAALGAAAAVLTPNVPLTPEAALNAYSRAGRQANARPAPAPANNAGPSVANIRLTTIKCVNKTGEVGKDDIFVNYLVATGATSFDLNTSIYQFRSGDEQFVKAADAQVFPQAGANQPANENVFIGAGIFDDDSADKARTLALVKTLIDVGAVVLTAVGQPEIAAFAPAAQELFAGVVAALPDTQFLGSDALEVKPNKQAVGENGAPKSFMAVQKTRKNGKVKFRYEIRGLQIN